MRIDGTILGQGEKHYQLIECMFVIGVRYQHRANTHRTRTLGLSTQHAVDAGDSGATDLDARRSDRDAQRSGAADDAALRG